MRYVRRQRGRYECTQCGEVLELAPDAIPRIVIDDTYLPTRVRILDNTGREVHRCEVRAP